MAVNEGIKDISMATLDTSIRQLLVHMIDKKLDHAVLVIPGSKVRVSVTVATESKTDEITRQVKRILGPR